MEQLSLQQVRSTLSAGQADSERTQFNTRVRKHFYCLLQIYWIHENFPRQSEIFFCVDLLRLCACNGCVSLLNFIKTSSLSQSFLT